MNLGPVKTKKAKQAFKEKKMSEKKEQMRLKIRGKLTEAYGAKTELAMLELKAMLDSVLPENPEKKDSDSP